MRYNLIILLSALMLVGCQLRDKGSEDAVRPIPVEVLEMSEQESVSRHTYVGTIEEKSSVTVSPTAGGQVLAVGVKRGDHVVAGQVLLLIDSTQAVQARVAAEALLRQAEDGYARAHTLYEEGGLTQQKLVELETQLTRARSMYASAEQMVADCRLTAPVAGVVSECRPQTGESVVPGVPVVTIINMDGMVVRFGVPEAEIASIRVGDRAVVQVPALGAGEMRIEVKDKSLLSDRVAHTYEVVADISGRTDLLPGMMAKVRMESDVVAGYVLPQECVQLLPEGAKVWVAEDHRAVRRTVVVGQHVAQGVLIVDSLSAGDKVITKGYQKLWQGAEITY